MQYNSLKLYYDFKIIHSFLNSLFSMRRGIFLMLIGYISQTVNNVRVDSKLVKTANKQSHSAHMNIPKTNEF